MISFTPAAVGPAKILDLDLENRPLSYWYDDRPTAQITAIATCWANDPRSMEVRLLGRDDYLDMLNGFVARYNEADVVTGHWLTRHDLPIISGALIEAGLVDAEVLVERAQKLETIPAVQRRVRRWIDSCVKQLAGLRDSDR